MKSAVEHPENFGPYLDRETSDPRCEEIRSHLGTCAHCRDEVESWRSFDAFFRGEEAGIEVPPFQWQRIAARLEARVPPGRFAGLRLMLQPWKLAWNLALASLLLAGVIVTGIEYRKGLEEKQLLLAVTRYAAEEGQRIASAGNPFRSKIAADDNPFSKSRFANENKPVVNRN